MSEESDVRNNWIIRNLSITGIYRHLSMYGEDPTERLSGLDY
jgi:hypothetical protein